MIILLKAIGLAILTPVTVLLVIALLYTLKEMIERSHGVIVFLIGLTAVWYLILTRGG